MQSLAAWGARCCQHALSKPCAQRVLPNLRQFARQDFVQANHAELCRSFHRTAQGYTNATLTNACKPIQKGLILTRFGEVIRSRQRLFTSEGLKRVSETLKSIPAVLRANGLPQAYNAFRGKATAAMGSMLGVGPGARSKATGVAALSEGLSDGMRKQLAVWLGVCSAWVFALVILGGITRLTRSGLSMTDWKFTGERPPTTPLEWAAEFAKYQASPEYRKVNKGMNLEEFKFIYWMEYAHRMWGRVLGLIFAVPAVYFAARGAINRPLGVRLGLLFAMGGAQGLVGWWMVRSGLQEPMNEYEVPRVSPYRLAAHLLSAGTIYSLLLWTTLSLAYPNPPSAVSPVSAVQGAAALRRIALPVAGLIALTAASGAFVAGLDAGHAYNTFPTMNGEWVPSEYWRISGWRNFFENTAAVQFNHRLLAVSTLAAVSGLWYRGRQLPLPGSSRVLLHALMATVAGQVTLGILTLLNYVPVSLGSAHQAGALTLFSVALGLMFSLRPFPHVSLFPAMASFLTPAAFASVAAVGGTVSQLT